MMLFDNTISIKEYNDQNLLTALNIALINQYRYRGYRYDSEVNLYYLNSRYYNPETARFINADGNIGQVGNIQSTNMFAYCANNPVMYTDITGYAPWWNWAISGAQLALGIALCFVPGAQGIGISLVVGGSLGLVANALSPAIGQAIGGASSIANGAGAVSTGISILGLGTPGLIGGIALILVGGATAAFGANEIVDAVSGVNYIRRWTGMSDTAYGWTYLGLNVASSIGSIAGRAYNLHATRTPNLGYDGAPNGYHYYDQNGNILFDFDYPHGNITYNHYHGWAGPGMTGRTSGHMSYLELIWWLLGGKS